MFIDGQKERLRELYKRLPFMTEMIAEVWARYSFKAGNHGDISLLAHKPLASAHNGGFSWVTANEPDIYWWETLVNGQSFRLIRELDEVARKGYIDFKHFN